MPTIRVGLAQLNTVVGDLDGNVDRILDAIDEAEAAGCDLRGLPRAGRHRLPARGPAAQAGFVADNRRRAREVAARTGGAPRSSASSTPGATCHNAAAVCAGGEVLGVYRKRLLPNYAVFDEQRYFAPGPSRLELYVIGGVRGRRVDLRGRLEPGRSRSPTQAAGGAELVVNINASPYYAGNGRARSACSRPGRPTPGAAIVYVNQVGGQDELVFDGASMVFDADGALLARAPQFDEGARSSTSTCGRCSASACSTRGGRCSCRLVPASPSPAAARRPRPPLVAAGVTPLEPEVDEVYEALVLGTRDYVAQERLHRRGDRAVGRHRLVAGGGDRRRRARARARARGAHAVALLERALASPTPRRWPTNLGIDYRTIAIEPRPRAFDRMLAPSFGEHPPGLTEENLQSRDPRRAADGAVEQASAGWC